MSNLPPSVLSALQFAKPLNQSGRFIPAGSHTFAVRSIVLKPPTAKGHDIETELEVLESSCLPAGARVIDRWDLTKRGKFESSNTDSDRVIAFVGALVGASTLDEAKGALAYVLDGTQQQAQPLRGVVVKCEATTKPPTATSKGFTNRAYAHVPQDGGAIAAMRARLDATENAPAPAAPSFAPPPAPAYTPPAAAPVAPPIAPAAPPSLPWLK